MSGAPPTSSRQRFRTTIVPAAVLVTVFLVTIVGAFVAPEGSGQLGGDFPAFYGAGSIVAEQGYENLYDPATQQAAQDGLIASEGGYLFFAYPPFVATAYSWLNPLGYRGAYVVQMMIMWLLAGATVALLMPVNVTVRRYPFAVLAALVLFQPILSSLIGGQNTIVTLFLFVAAYRAEASGRELLAGVAIGLMAYKPQYGIPLAVIAAGAGRIRMLAGTAVTWLGLFLAAAAALGIGWIGPWWEQASAFRDTNATVNGPLFVSWPGFLEHLAGLGDSAGRALGLAVGAGGVLLLIAFWRRHRDFADLRYTAAAVGLVMIAPQSLFYEAGIAAVAVMLVGHRAGKFLGVVSAVWASGWLYAATSGVWNTAVLVAMMTVIALGVPIVASRQQAPGPMREPA